MLGLVGITSEASVIIFLLVFTCSPFRKNKPLCFGEHAHHEHELCFEAPGSQASPSSSSYPGDSRITHRTWAWTVEEMSKGMLPLGSHWETASYTTLFDLPIQRLFQNFCHWSYILVQGELLVIIHGAHVFKRIRKLQNTLNSESQET